MELLTLGSFSDPSQTRNIGLLRGLRGDRHEAAAGQPVDADSRTVYPFTFSFVGSGQLGGQYTLWTDSAALRNEWKAKFEHAKALRNADIEANKVSLAELPWRIITYNATLQIFELNPVARDTFFATTFYGNPVSLPPNTQNPLTGRVTCSVPFRKS